MLDAYLGIASPAGLHALVTDHTHTRLFLFRRLARFPSQPICGFWAVMPKDAADEVRSLLADGERIEALKMIQQRARDLGDLVPESEECDREF
jgi:hypothetical protein